MRPPLGLQISMPRGVSINGSYRFPPHRGPVLLPRGPADMVRPGMPMNFDSRGPMVLGRMPGPPQPVIIMQPSQRPGTNGPPLIRQPIPPGKSHKKYNLSFLASLRSL